MPGYSCSFKYLQKLINRPEIQLESLEKYLDSAKSEFKSYDEEKDELKLENNDTNRPDLWSAEGTARELLSIFFNQRKHYDFFEKEAQPEHRVKVDSSITPIRPYIACFAVSNIVVDDPILKSLIQSQEKLCDNFGKKRELIAIGIHCANKITYPVNYSGVDPESTSFTPLGFEENMNLKEILEKHPKGQEYGHIIAAQPRYPFLCDAKGAVLSFPPIINSNYIGKVQVGDDKLFIDITGMEKEAVLLIANILACNFADAGATIEPFIVEYPSGEEVKVPYRFTDRVAVESTYAEKLMGVKSDAASVAELLQKLGHETEISGDKVIATPPPYRRDILHPADLVEDICIAYGYNNFQLIMPDSFTSGGESRESKISSKVRDLLIGTGFQEVMTYILTSKDGQATKSGYPEKEAIEIANPMTESYGVVRSRLLPLLLEIESKNPKAEYPHRIFETGEVLKRDTTSINNYRTENNIAALIAHGGANFSEIHSILQAIFYYMNWEYELQEAEDPAFISGRCGKIVYKGEEIGVIGEIHPQILTNWGIGMPAAGFEFKI